jgi:excisionase family DNA binding protein
MEKMIILQGVTVDGLLEHIDAIVEKRLNEKIEQLNPKKGYKFLSRKEVSQILKVSLVTISDWSKRGIINSYRIGTRVRYKSDEIEEALIKRKFRS